MPYQKTLIEHIVDADKTAGANAARLVTTTSGDSLAQNAPLLYDANGNVISTATRTGNTTNFATAIAGSKTTGNYPKWDANGNLTDGDTGSGSGSAIDFANLMSEVMDWYAANNATNMDHKININDYYALIHHDTNATSGFLSPSNALHTVTTGKKAVILLAQGTRGVFSDPSFRGMRLRNTTDGTDVITQANPWNQSVGLTDTASQSGGADDAKLKEVAAGKTIELQTWNGNASSRGRGGYVVFKEVAA